MAKCQHQKLLSSTSSSSKMIILLPKYNHLNDDKNINDDVDPDYLLSLNNNYYFIKKTLKKTICKISFLSFFSSLSISLLLLLFLFININYVRANSTLTSSSLELNDDNNNTSSLLLLDQSKSIPRSSFHLRSKDGEKGLYHQTEHTKAKDIRKLLEDYVRYLANLPEIRKEIHDKNNDDNNSNNDDNDENNNRKKAQHDIISTAETNNNEKASSFRLSTDYHTFVPIINHPSSRGEYVYHHHHNPHKNKQRFFVDNDNNNDKQKKQQNNLDEKPKSKHYYNEELSSFIDSVLGSVMIRKNPMKTTKSTTSTTSTTTTPTPTSTTLTPTSTTTELIIDDKLINNNMTDINDDIAIEELMEYVGPKNNSDNNEDDDEVEEEIGDEIDQYLYDHHLDNHDNYDNNNFTITETTIATTTTTTAAPPTILETTIDPLLLIPGMLQTNNEHISDENVSDIDLHNVVDNDIKTTSYATSTTTTTIKPSIKEKQINHEQNNENNSINNNNVQEKKPLIFEINQNDLLEQLKRTRELLSIQIEKLKTLERTVFRQQEKESTLPTTTETNISVNGYHVNNTNLLTTTIPTITTTTTTELPFDSTTEFDNNETSTTTASSILEHSSSLLSFNNDNIDSQIMTTTTKSLSSALDEMNNDQNNNNNNTDVTIKPQMIEKNNEEFLNETGTTTTEIPMFNEKSFVSIINENRNNSNADNDNDKIIYSTNSSNDNEFNVNKDQLLLNNLKSIPNTTANNVAEEKYLINQINNELKSTTTTSKTFLQHQNDHHQSLPTNSLPDILINSSIIEPIITTTTKSSESSPLFAIDEPNSVVILSHSNVNDNNDVVYNENNYQNNVDLKNDNETDNVETMILTHVPKITIIHKIMKPFHRSNIDNNNNSNGINYETTDNSDNLIKNDNNNNNDNNNRNYLFESDENLLLYQEALRKHQDLIRSTMSSMSLYPATIKRFRIKNLNGNNTNRINSFGEMYLLPNFQSSNHNESIIDKQQQQQENIKSNSIPLVFVPITLSTNSNNDSLLSKQIIPIVNNNNNDNDNDNENNSNITINDLLLQTISKSINELNEKHNNDLTNDNNHNNSINFNNNDEKNKIDSNNIVDNVNVDKQTNNNNDLQHQQQQKPKRISKKNKQRPKLSLTNPQTIMSINRNPGNLLRLYRPRFKHRKRFRKIRLPNNNNNNNNHQHQRLILKKENNNDALLTNNNTIDYSVVNNRSLSNEDIINSSVVNTLSLPTTTITIQPSSLSSIMNDNVSDSVINKNNDINNDNDETIMIPTTTISPENEIEINSYDHHVNNFDEISVTTTSTSTTSSTTTSTTTKPPINNNKKLIKDKKNNNSIPFNYLINSTNNNNTDNRINKFKVFCTYDAYRSMPFSNHQFNDSNNDDNYENENGRYFNMDELEKNSIYLKYCTHLIYAFVNIDLNGELYIGLNQIQHHDNLNRDYNQQCLSRIKKLKQNNPHLSILIAVGGWDTPPQLFSLMVSTQKLRERLSTNIYQFIFENNFDGAIIAWFYPVYGSKSSMDSRTTRAVTTSHNMFQFDDKQNLIKFLRLIRKKFDTITIKNRLELGLMVPPFQEFIDRGYDAKKLSESVDHFILMTYDYYGSWENHVHHFSPLFAQKNNSFDERNIKFNINYTVNYWINKKHAPKNQTMIGVAFYGRSFTLMNELNAKIGALSMGPGLAGPITNRPGLLSFNELCELYLGNPNVRLNEDDYRITANLQLHDQWVGFDDELSLYLKTKYAIGKKLSGIFIWSINYDDYKNRCGWGQFPLLKAVNKAIEHCKLWNQCSPLILRNNDHHSSNLLSNNNKSSTLLSTRR